MKLKNVVERLASVGHVILSSDLMEAIFNVLSEKYNTCVISINSKSYTVEEIESILLGQKSKLRNIPRNLIKFWNNKLGYIREYEQKTKYRENLKF